VTTKKRASVSFQTPTTQKAKAEIRNTDSSVKKETSQSTPVSVKREPSQLTPENLKSLVTKVLSNADSDQKTIAAPYDSDLSIEVGTADSDDEADDYVSLLHRRLGYDIRCRWPRALNYATGQLIMQYVRTKMPNWSGERGPRGAHYTCKSERSPLHMPRRLYYITQHTLSSVNRRKNFWVLG
jgi:hypothetical protein